MNIATIISTLQFELLGMSNLELQSYKINSGVKQALGYYSLTFVLVLGISGNDTWN